MCFLRTICCVALLFAEVSSFAETKRASTSHQKMASAAQKNTPSKAAKPGPHIVVPSLDASSSSQNSNSKNNDENKNQGEISIWDSKPEEISAVNVQILDKTSGKVIKRRIEVGQPLEFGGIKVTLNRCFKNAPEDPREIYAFIEISERRSIFSKWLFASSPAINLFEHPQYDVRVEF